MDIPENDEDGLNEGAFLMLDTENSKIPVFPITLFKVAFKVFAEGDEQVI